MLLRSWMRRKRFEALIMAKEMERLLGGQPHGGARPTTTATAGQQWVRPDQMLDMMGISL